MSAALSADRSLPRLQAGRLRATWLLQCARTIGLGVFMHAAGISCSQRLGDLAAQLPAVRPRQLSVRTLIAGMLLTAVHGRPAHLRRVHQALLDLDASDQHRLAIITQWTTGPHLLTYRQVERTFGLLTAAVGQPTPDGTPSQTLSDVLDALLEASVTVLGEPACSSYAVDWTDLETWSCPPHKPRQYPDDTTPASDDTQQPTPDNSDSDSDSDSGDDRRCADPEASWGHRRGNHPGQKDELFYG